MDEYKVRITHQARENLQDIERYIEQRLLSPLAAKNTMEAIKAEIQSLSRMPGRVRLTPEQPWHDLGVRRDRVKNFYIYFWVDEENMRVQIIGVIYARRDQAEQLERMGT